MDPANPGSPPAPPFVLSRETKIRIDRDGRFWNEGAEITHEALVRSLAGWVDVDPESGRYILKNSVNWAFVTVEDAPLVVRSLLPERLLALSDGTLEPLDPRTLRLDEDDVPYCDVRGGKLPARFSRTAAYALLEDARIEDEGRKVYVDGREVRRVPRGAGARRG